MIALQINNWNEGRRANKIEDKLLSELLNSIKADYGVLNRGIERNQEVQTSCEIILSYLENDLLYHDSLEFHFMNSNNWMSLFLRRNAYENAKSYGLSFMSDSLRLQLTQFYERTLLFGDEMMKRQNMYYYNTVVPILTQLFKETIPRTCARMEWFLITMKI